MASKLIPGGLLIAIEGIDGAGKTTLARTLTSTFESVGAVVSMSKEPTSGKYGTMLRNSASHGRLSPGDEVTLLLLDRREHVDMVIKPALARGEIVILDRYFPSMVAYQGAAGVPTDTLLEANSFAPRPDVLLLLDLDPLEGISRIEARGDKPNAFEEPHTLQKCREIFLALKLPGLVIVDARQSADLVAAASQKHVLLAIADKLMKAESGPAEACEALVEFTPSLA